MKYVGIDLHSNRFTCCFIFQDGNREQMTFSLNPESLSKFVKYLDLNTSVIVEASTNTFKFVELIREHVNEVIVISTHQLKLIPVSNKKTDKIDSEKLAIYLKMCKASGEGLINPVYIPEQQIQDLRSLFTTYHLLKRHISAIKNRIHSLLKQDLKPYTKEYIFSKRNIGQIRELKLSGVSSYQLNFLFDELELREQSIKKIEDQIKITGSKYISEIDVLTSMKGVSVFTAIAIIADIATVERFPNSKHFTSYLRSAPRVESSNETVIVKSTNKNARKLSVSLISQSLNHFRDSNSRLHDWYSRKEPYHKKKGKLRMALCRKVFAEIYQMLKKNEYHYFRNARLHDKKMNEYIRFLGEKGVQLRKSA